MADEPGIRWASLGTRIRVEIELCSRCSERTRKEKEGNKGKTGAGRMAASCCHLNRVVLYASGYKAAVSLPEADSGVFVHFRVCNTSAPGSNLRRLTDAIFLRAHQPSERLPWLAQCKGLAASKMHVRLTDVFSARKPQALPAHQFLFTVEAQPHCEEGKLIPRRWLTNS